MSDGLNNNEYTSDKRERLPFINYILSHRNSERDNSSELWNSFFNFPNTFDNIRKWNRNAKLL